VWTLSDHDHDHRPGTDDQLAALDVLEAMVQARETDVRAAAESGTCPACTAIATASFAANMVAALRGDGPFVSQETARLLLAMIFAARRAVREAAG